jgi:hypothetical protein
VSQHRWTFGTTDGGRRYIPMDIEAPRPWSLQQDSCTVRWDYAWGSDSDCWSLLHTAGPDNSGRVIRLHLLGPTAIIGAGPAGGGRINVGQPGTERVAGGDFGGPSQDGPGPRCGTLWEIDMTYSPVGRLRRFTSTLYKGSVNSKCRVVYDEVPNPCYYEYICYISPFLCLRGQKLQQVMHPGGAT